MCVRWVWWWQWWCGGGGRVVVGGWWWAEGGGRVEGGGGGVGRGMNCWEIHYIYVLNYFDQYNNGFNTLRSTHNGRRFADNIFKCTFFNGKVHISVSLKFDPMGLINNIPAWVHIMAWHRPGDKPLSASMVSILLTHICVTGPRWVNSSCLLFGDFQSHRYRKFALGKYIYIIV